MLMSVGDSYIRAGRDTMGKMARLTYELTGATKGPVSEMLEQELRALRDRLSNDLADFFRSQRSWAPTNATDAVGNGFLNALD